MTGKVTIPMNSSTLESVEMVSSRTKGAAPSGTPGVMIGGAVLGVPGMLMGKFANDYDRAAASKRIIDFTIRFLDGGELHCSGSVREYERALRNVYELPPELQAEAKAEAKIQKAIKQDRKIEKKARVKEIQKQKLPFREAYRQISALDEEFK